MISENVLEKLEFKKVLNYIQRFAVSDPGKAFVQDLRPLSETSEIRHQGAIVTEAKEILINNRDLPLDSISDISEALTRTRVEGSYLSAKQCLHVYQLLVTARKIAAFIAANEEYAPALAAYGSELYTDKMLERHIERVIDDTGEVKPNASRELASIRDDIRKKSAELQKAVKKILKNLAAQDLVREDYMTLRDGRIVVPVKVEHKRQIRGFIHSESASGQTVYIEPEETLTLNNEIISLSFAEKREIERILKELTKRIADAAGDIKNNIVSIAFIDSVFARAKYSIAAIGNFPEFDNGSELVLQEARHPILYERFGREKTIPFTLDIKDDKIIVITGPNAGGKTVLLKSVGLLAVMAQAGMHIPASADSKLPYFENILVDIGDQQSIEDDLSTFSSHLASIKEIIDTAGRQSLALIDEIGTGTDPSAGSALASSVLVNLKKLGAYCLATTHHGNLKVFAGDTDGFQNASMEFDTAQLKPTYKFRQGLPGSSYAFEIAERTGFSKEFIATAHDYLDADEGKIERILVDMEARSQTLRKKLNAIEIENTRLRGLSQLYEQNVKKLEVEKKEILKKAKADAENYLKGANRKIEEVVKELRSTKADKETVKKAHKVLDEVRSSNTKIIVDEPEAKPKIDWNAGETAKIKDTETVGVLESIDKQKKTAVLVAGALKLQVKFANLIPAKKKEKKKTESAYSSFQMSDVQQRLDIRGERPDEIEYEVVRFLDDAYTAGIERIEILHGKGTGALKKTVRLLLEHHEKIANFYYAPIEMGGEGITIAEFKHE